IGRGLSEMLTTALFQTNRFVVLEREQLEAVLAEQGMRGGRAAGEANGAGAAALAPADLLVAGAVIGFEANVSQKRGGLSSIIGGLPLLGVFAGSFDRTISKARVAMDLRLID